VRLRIGKRNWFITLRTFFLSELGLSWISLRMLSQEHSTIHVLLNFRLFLFLSLPESLSPVQNGSGEETTSFWLQNANGGHGEPLQVPRTLSQDTGRI